jgi:glycosyltransferase involved in cell wall biosynthesis
MRILHVTPYFVPALSFGGVVSAVAGLAAEQVRRGHRVTVLTTDALDRSTRIPSRRETLDGIEVIRCRNVFPWLRRVLNLSSPPGIWQASRALPADVVHLHELRTVEALLLDRARPLVLSPHGTLPYATGRGDIKRLWDQVVGRTVMSRVTAIAALTAAEADEARHLWQHMGVALPPVTIIPNGVSLDTAHIGHLRQRRRDDHLTVLFLGRLQERKGVQLLLPAFAEVARYLPQARLVVAGPDEGMRDMLLALSRTLAVNDRVTFAGMVTAAERDALLARADVFVLPAVGEGLSMAALEAMAAGLPLLLTPGCNLPDVEARGAGLLVERSINALADGLRLMLQDSDIRHRMGQQAQAWSASFTWSTVAEQMDALYERLIG